MGAVAWLASVLGVPRVVASTLIVLVAAVMALPGERKDGDSSTKTVKLEMDPWERVKLAEALKEARR